MPQLKVILSPAIVIQAPCFGKAACSPLLHSDVCSDPEGPLPPGLCHAEAPLHEASPQAASQALSWGRAPRWGWYPGGAVLRGGWPPGGAGTWVGLLLG